MKITLLREMQDALTLPVYVFQKSPGGHTCDKVWIEGEKNLRRERYMLTAKQSCTCLGFVKTQKDCKHLKMLTGRDGWVKGNVPSSYAAEEATRLAKIIAEKLPEVAKGWTADLDQLPDTVECLTLTMPEKGDAFKMVSVKNFPQLGSLGIVLISKEFK